MAKVTFNVVVNEESDGTYWAEVKELPGCFASGHSFEELQEALFEAMQLWLPDGVELDDPTWNHLHEGPPDSTGKRSAKGKVAAARGKRTRKKKMRVVA